jgi:hypothetical protein
MIQIMVEQENLVLIGIVKAYKLDMMSEFLSQEEITLLIMIAMFPLMLEVFFNLLLTDLFLQLLKTQNTIVTIIQMKFGINLSDLIFNSNS